MTALAALSGWWTLVGLCLRKEGANALLIAANAFLLPVCICYLGFMLSPGDPAAQRRWIVGALVVAFGGACLGQVALGVLVDRFLGPRRLIDTLPVPRATYLAAHLAYGLALAMLITGSGAATLVLTGLTRPTWGALPALLGVAALSGLALSAAGVAIAQRVPSLQAGDLAVSVLGLVLVIISPVFYPIGAIPVWLQPLGWISPYTHMAALGVSLAEGRGLGPAHLAAMLLWLAAACAGLATRGRAMEQAA